MTMTRKGFLSAAAGGALMLILEGCGGDGGSDGTGTSAPLSCSATTISNNHGHALSIPEADLDSTVDKTYDIQGTATHNHQVKLTSAQLQQLKAGQPVTVTSTITASHSHDVTSTCAS